MLEQPKLDEVARAVNVSIRHLRRLFWQARQESPQAAFTRLRLERAMGLLSLSNLKLDAIAVSVGSPAAAIFAGSSRPIATSARCVAQETPADLRGAGRHAK